MTVGPISVGVLKEVGPTAVTRGYRYQLGVPGDCSGRPKVVHNTSVKLYGT